MKKIFLSGFALITTAIFFSCQKNLDSGDQVVAPKLPTTPFDYVSTFAAAPDWFNKYSGPDTNPLTNDGATLGRVLFYDKSLSRNNTVSCGSCHRAQNGFSDFKSFSTGFDFGLTLRNAMPITNASQQTQYFWDCRVKTLEEMVLKPVQNHIEMGMEDSSFLIEKLNKINFYPDLFEKAFGSSQITYQRIANALAQFIRSMVTFNSKYDEGTEMNFSNFTQSEMNGMNLFLSLPCQKCHTPGNFGGTGDTANIGLDVNYSDVGFMNISGSEVNNGDFKIPSLRNVALTAPYMHDGRFKTLEEVVRFYNSEIQANPNLSFPLNQNASVVAGGTYGSITTTIVTVDPVLPVEFNLSDQQISDIVAFLNTLTDYTFITQEKYSDPFK